MKYTLFSIPILFCIVLFLCGCTPQTLKNNSVDLNSLLVADTLYKEELDSQEIEEIEIEKESEESYDYTLEDFYIDETSQNYYIEDNIQSYTTNSYNNTYYAEYNELYNEDGPSHTMPGWHDGYLETYYNASNHYLAGTWTLDDKGFYHDENGRYVVGVDINDINPETGEPYQYGDVVDTGKGEGVVYDYGQGAHVHDFATNW